VTRTARRIVAPSRAAEAFDGRGNYLYGGRWTGDRRFAVYVASSTALALLETMVHAPSRLLPRYVVFPVEFDDALVVDAGPSQLPANWRENPFPVDLQAIGDAWLDRSESPVLRVPSAVVPDESNYILNPEHPDFRRLKIGASFPLDVDRRLRL
jgi:RES domain-containing protein